MKTQSKDKKTTAFIHKRLNATAITIATFISLIIITVCIFWYTINHALNNYLSQQTEVLGNSLATQAAFNATQSILSNDLLSLNVLLNRLVVDDNILSARVYNKKDELLAEADSGAIGSIPEQSFSPNNDKRRVYSSSIKFRNEIVGHVLITLNKTPAQATLQHLNSLLIGVAIFISAITLLLITLVTKWLFSPINQAIEVLVSFHKGHKDITFPLPMYKEAREIHSAITAIQSIKQPELTSEEALVKDSPLEETEPKSEKDKKAQFEINFDAIFEESKQRSCVLYFKIINLEEWNESMTQLQVANLLTPIYRAIFQASEVYLGQVHQYKNNSAIILFSAINSEDNLYIDAVSTAQLFLGLIEKLLQNELYSDTPKLDFHLGLHQGGLHITGMVKNNLFNPVEIEPLLETVDHMSQSESKNKLVISDDIFTLPHIQNRVFTSLPEVIEIGEKEVLAYEVKGISDKYKKTVQEHITEITNSK